MVLDAYDGGRLFLLQKLVRTVPGEMAVSKNNLKEEEG